MQEEFGGASPPIQTASPSTSNPLSAHSRSRLLDELASVVNMEVISALCINFTWHITCI